MSLCPPVSPASKDDPAVCGALSPTPGPSLSTSSSFSRPDEHDKTSLHARLSAHIGNIHRIEFPRYCSPPLLDPLYTSIPGSTSSWDRPPSSSDMSHRPPLSGAEGPSSSSATSMAGPSSFGMNRSPTVSTASNPAEGTAPARNVSRYSQLVQLKMRNALLAVQAQQQQQQQQQGSAGSSSASSSNPTSASTLSSSSLSGMTACTSQPLRDLGGWSSASANDSSGRSSVLQGIAQEHVAQMAAHPQLIYQPVPEQQHSDWYNKDGGMYSAFLQTSSYDTHHPVFDLALNGYVPTGAMASNVPPQQQQQYGLGDSLSQQSSSLGAWATPSPALPSASPDSRLGQADGNSTSSPRQGMAELSRYQQLMAAKFPAHRPSADNGIGSGNGRGLYGDQEQQQQAADRQQSPSGLAYDPDIRRVIAAFPNPSTLGPDGKSKTAYQSDDNYPLLANMEPGHFINDPNSYRAFASNDSYAGQGQQGSNSNYPSSFNAGPSNAGESALGLQGLPNQWVPTSTGSYGGEAVAPEQSQQAGVAPWSTVAPNQTAYAPASSDYASGFGSSNPYDQFNPAYRHSVPFDNRSADESVPDMPRHHSTSVLHSAGGPSSYGASSGTGFERSHGSVDAYATDSQPLYFHQSQQQQQQQQQNPYLNTQPPSPTSSTMPPESTNHMAWPAAAGSSTSFASGSAALNNSILPPTIAPSMASMTDLETETAESGLAKPALSAVAQGKRPAEGEKKKSKKRSLSAISSAGGPSAAAGGDGADKPGEVKKAPLACHFCRKRKLKCDGARPTCANCDKRNLQCTVDEVIKRRGPGKKKKERSQRGAAAAAAAAAAVASDTSLTTPLVSSAMPLAPPMQQQRQHQHLGGPSILPPHAYPHPQYY